MSAMPGLTSAFSDCKAIGLEYSCSVWDVTSAKEIVTLNPVLIKVGSPSNQHWEMQRVLRDEYTGEVHISTGMTTKEEVEKIVTFWEAGKGDAKNRVVLGKGIHIHTYKLFEPLEPVFENPCVFIYVHYI